MSSGVNRLFANMGFQILEEKEKHYQDINMLFQFLTGFVDRVTCLTK